MNSLLKLSEVTYAFEGSSMAVLNQVSLEIHEGDFALVIGPSGGGKTVLLTALAGVIGSNGGKISGQIIINGVDILRCTDKQRGFAPLVLADPQVQLTNLDVEGEVAFGPENLGIPVDEIHRRIERVLTTIRMDQMRHNFVYALSGGQMQRVAIGAILAMHPQVLLMDGPTTNLDPEGAVEVLQLIEQLRQGGAAKAVVIAANKIDAFLPWANRIIVVDQGRVVLDGSVEEVLIRNRRLLTEMGVFVPQISWLASLVPVCCGTFPRTIHELADAIGPGMQLRPSANGRTPHSTAPAVIRVEEVYFAYDQKPVLKGVNLTVRRGEFLAVAGINGGGKTTLMLSIAGLLQPDRGRILVGNQDTKSGSVLGRVAYVFQYPPNQFVRKTVREEIQLSLEQRGLRGTNLHAALDRILTDFDLQKLAHKSPFDLSMGEQRRLSVATMVAMQPEILILDEPTTGLDRRATDQLMQLLRVLVEEADMTVIQVCHDMEQIAEYADRVVVMGDGQIIFDGSPRELFTNTTILARGKLSAPPVVALASRLWPGQPAPLTPKEMEERVDATA